MMLGDEAMARRGRPRRAGVRRTPGGRISRAAEAMLEHVEPIATRMRLFGLVEADARDQLAGSVVGRLLLRWRRMGDRAGGITDVQYEAAMEYRRQAEAYRRALAAPDALRRATRGASLSMSDDEHARWCRAVIDAYDRAVTAVMTVQCELDNRGRQLLAALDYLVLRDEYHQHLLGDLRVALNALVRHYGYER